MSDIVISEFMDEAAVARLSARFSTLYAPDLAEKPDALKAALTEARALIVRNRTEVRADLIEGADALECVGRLGVGVDNIDTQCCARRGIAVYPAAAANALSVAEYVISTALLLLRGAYLSTPAVAAGQWPRGELMHGREASGKVIGLVGFGASGRETARRAEVLGLDVIATDPHIPASDAAWNEAPRTDLSTLLAEADVVSLHVPLTDETRYLIDAAALARMKPGAILINAARGGIVDETALVAALKEGRLGGAALDVFETEPLTAEAGAVFADLPNVVLTPHIAGLTAESNLRVGRVIADAVINHLEGRK
ncbi:hydroxyacid dehydrogenase [Afifella aestuarii]|uniref:hydroxyacid dehydrogenase n=1 Tax=Afifella aestuarii TaxID=1909496 RepID=UPI000FE398C9|nr:hydroxyacid dehydrogenase [Afifella aestuarii]